MAFPQLFICRNQNRNTVDHFRETMEQNFDPGKNLANATSPTPDQLKAMQALARMREQADRSNMGFAGSFITESGYHYSISNLDEDDIQEQVVDFLVRLKIKETFDFGQIQRYYKIIQTEEGVKIEVINEDPFDFDTP
mgnify:CR=1 FL=1